MNYKEVITQFNQKKVKDYSFMIAFFLIFSIFIVFAIRPNIITAIELRNELADLKNKDAEYEKLIQRVVEHQSILESQRTKLYVLDEAIPEKYYQHYTLIDDLTESASKSGTLLVSLDVPEIKLVTGNSDTGLKTVNVSFSAIGKQRNLGLMFKEFLNQRRIKEINEVLLEADKESTVSADWDGQVKFDSFYYKL